MILSVTCKTIEKCKNVDSIDQILESIQDSNFISHIQREVQILSLINPTPSQIVLYILNTDLAQRRQKLGTILDNKMLQKMDLSKNTTDESCSTNHIFFISKKLFQKRFGWFLILKTDIENKKFAIFKDTVQNLSARYGKTI